MAARAVNITDRAKRYRGRAVKITRRGWTVDLLGLKRDIAEGTLKADDRDFIEKVLPRFCDFAAGRVDSWPVKTA